MTRLMLAGGTGRLVRRPTGVFFDPTGNNEKLATDFDEAASDGEAIELVKRHLIDGGFNAAPLVVLSWASGDLDLLIFGDVQIHTSAVAAPMVSGAGSGSWVERHLGAIERGPEPTVDLWSGDDTDPMTDLRLGVVACAGFKLAVELAPADTPAAAADAAADAPAADAAAADMPAAEVSAAADTAADAPAADMPADAAEDPAAETPAGEAAPAAPAPEAAPAAEPAADSPAADAPAADMSPADAAVADPPAADSPAADAPVADSPAADAPAADAPVADAPAADALAADTPVPEPGTEAPFAGRETIPPGPPGPPEQPSVPDLPDAAVDDLPAPPPTDDTSSGRPNPSPIPPAGAAAAAAGLAAAGAVGARPPMPAPPSFDEPVFGDPAASPTPGFDRPTPPPPPTGMPSDQASPPPPPSGSMPSSLAPGPPPPAPGFTDDDPTTAAPAELPTGVEDPFSGTESSGGPRVGLIEAAHCPAGHANPPALASCYSCGLSLGSDKALTLVEQPAVGRIVFAGGQSVPMDRAMKMGRKPDAEQGVHPVIIDHAEVSRSHAAVQIEGWKALITDLGSRNGTYVIPPNDPSPVRLDANVPHVLEHGTKVHIGGPEVSFTYLLDDGE